MTIITQSHTTNIRSSIIIMIMYCVVIGRVILAYCAEKCFVSLKSNDMTHNHIQCHCIQSYNASLSQNASLQKWGHISIIMHMALYAFSKKVLNATNGA